MFAPKARKRLYVGVKTNHSGRMRKKTARNRPEKMRSDLVLGSTDETLRPVDPHQKGGKNDQRLPNQEMGSLEQLRKIEADIHEAHHSDKVQEKDG
jgi:hypothetical protein